MNIQKINLNDINFGNKGINKVRVPYDKTREMINADIKRKVDYVKSVFPKNGLMIESVIENIYREGIELAENFHIKL